MPRDFSIDLETLSNKYNSPVLSIGIAGFDRDTGKIGPTFYVEIDPDDAIKHGVVLASTLAWWMRQSSQAKQVFESSAKKLKLRDALQGAGDFLRSQGKGTPTVWGNGSSFDITILEHAYDVAGQGLEPPWHFWNIRDMRTIVDVANIDKASMPMQGVAHNALDDATYQAEVICMAFKKLKGTKAPERITPTVSTIDEDDEL